MSGGIFKNQPFVMNPKCIIFSLIMLAGYILMGGRNPIFYFLIFVISYVLMAWYDWFYMCEYKMYSGTNTYGSPTAIFKPQYREIPEMEKIYLNKVYAFHFIFVAPLLIYIGINGKDTPKWILQGLGGLGILAGSYHLFRFFNPRV